MPKGIAKEKPTPRTMRVVREWNGESFSYVRVYSDGTREAATRREAEKYEQAFDTTVRTVRTKIDF